MGFLNKDKQRLCCGYVTFADGRKVPITDHSEYKGYLLLRTQDGGRIFFGYLYDKEKDIVYQQFYDGGIKKIEGAKVDIQPMHYEE